MVVSMEINEPLNQDVAAKPRDIKINRIRQYLAALAVSLGGFSAGTVLAWTSPALEFLLEDKSAMNITTQSKALPGFTITTAEEAIVGSILHLGALVFAIPSGKCADLMGRKPILILSAFFYLLNFILIGCAQNILMLVLARFFAGLGLGSACVVCPMYIGEIADASVRGTLGSILNVLLGLGVLYTTVIGAFANWIGLSVSLAVIPLIFGVLVVFLPESPVYLLSAEKPRKAKKALMFFRRDKAVVAEELAFLQKQSLEHQSGGNFIEFFTKKCYRKSLIAGTGIFALQQLCGINVVVFFTVPIFRAAGSSLNPALAAITTNSMTCLVGVLSIFVIEKRNRRYFLTLSSFSMMTGILGLGLFFNLKECGVSFAGLQFLPILSTVLFMAGFSIGFGPVPWILITELYPHEIRGIASGVVVVINWLSAFIVTLTYPILMHGIGSYFTFYLYGLVNFLGIVFIRFAVPETKS